jgi:hypothetical protein
MSLESPALAAVLSASELENRFKMAQVLHIRGDHARAADTYKSVCVSVDRIVRANPGCHSELRHVGLCLAKLSELSQQRQDTNKALAYIQLAKKVVEYVAVNEPNLESEDSADGADLPEHSLPDLLDEMRALFDSPDAPPPRDPSEVLQMVLDAKRRSDRQQALENLRLLNRMRDDEQEKRDTSRWAQAKHYVEQHPMRVAVVMIVFCALVAFATALFQESQDGRKTAEKRPKPSPIGPARKFDMKMPGKKEAKEIVDRWRKNQL